MDRSKINSLNLKKKKIIKLGELFPHCIIEKIGLDGNMQKSIDFDLLKQELSDCLEEGASEKYHLNWPGKKEALLQSNTPSFMTLRPYREESINFDSTKNIFIEGDNLEVLKILQNIYLSKIKMIYIDPPYNTGNDFIYKDNFSQERSSNGRIHSGWPSMMYSRLKIAWRLLTDDGVIFISIDEEEYANLKLLCDEIFGNQKFVTTIHIQMSCVQGQKIRAAREGNIVKNAEYILIYSKSGKKNIVKNILYEPSEYDTHYSIYLKKYEDYYVEEPLGEYLYRDKKVKKIFQKLYGQEIKSITNNNIKFAYRIDPEFRNIIHNLSYNIVCDDKVTALKIPESIKLSRQRVIEYKTENRSYLLTINSKNNIRQRIRLKDKIRQANDFKSTFGCSTIRGDWWADFYKDMGNVNKEGEISYSNGKKPVRLLKQLAYMVGCKDKDMVMDFFAGSGSFGHAIMELNSEQNSNIRTILVQLPEQLDKKIKSQRDAALFCEKLKVPLNLCELAKERLRRAGRKLKSINKLNFDYGFRVLKLDSFRTDDLSLTLENKKEDIFLIDNDTARVNRSSEDFLFQILLYYKIDLTLSIRVDKIKQNNIIFVGDNILVICFDREAIFSESFYTYLADKEPERVILKDASFENDLKRNIIKTFKSRSPTIELEIL